jgi:hypothetical protein
MKSLILICALGLSHADCTIDSATVVLQGPEGGGPARCGFLAQAYLASTSIAGYLDDAHYLKVSCSPESPRRADARDTGRPIAAR